MLWPQLMTGPDERSEFKTLCRRVESTVRAWYNFQFEDLNVRWKFDLHVEAVYFNVSFNLHCSLYCEVEIDVWHGT
jgi:hypothetical protein